MQPVPSSTGRKAALASEDKAIWTSWGHMAKKVKTQRCSRDFVQFLGAEQTVGNLKESVGVPAEAGEDTFPLPTRVWLG